MKDTLDTLMHQYAAIFPDTPFAVQYWDGDRRQYGDGDPCFTLKIHTPGAVKRALRDGSLGFAEAYMDGDIDIEGDMQALLKFKSAPITGNVKLSPWQMLRFLVSNLLTRNTVSGARENVSRHYDLGNEFFRMWLDESMTYTCAYFQSPDDTLEQAQRSKHEHISRKLRLEPGVSLVDIGFGWGAMLRHAAEVHDVCGTGYSISEQQTAWAEQENERRGLMDRIKLHLTDYREAEGLFDRFVSIGMFEQVGQEFIETFFDKVQDLLKPGGIGVLHTIASHTPMAGNPFLEKYIFPGGHLFQLGEITLAMEECGLYVIDVEDLRLHYAETIDRWIERFEACTDRVQTMYDERFVRMWRLYLNGAAQGFRWGSLRLYQIVFTHGHDNQVPRTRAYLYGGSPESFDVPVYEFNQGQ